MKLNILYNGQTISVADGESLTLKCKDLKARGNITVEAAKQKETFNFYIDLDNDPESILKNEIFTAEEGMTWEEWCKSKYNTGNFSCASETYVTRPAGSESRVEAVTTVEDSQSDCVQGADVIQATDYYIIEINPGAGN